MGLVFLSLGVLMLAMMTLGRVFRQPTSNKTTPEPAVAPNGPAQNEEAVVAALAVALALSQEKATPTLRIPLLKMAEERAISAWGLAGRQRQMNSRNLRGR